MSKNGDATIVKIFVKVVNLFKSMDKVELARQNLGRVFYFRHGHVLLALQPSPMFASKARAYSSEVK